MPMDLPVAGARAGWDGVGRWFGSGRSEGRQGCGQRGQRGNRSAQVAAMCGVGSAAQGCSPGAHPARVEMACWCQSGAVDRRCGRCRDRRVKPLPGVRHNSRQCQRLPTGIRPDRYRRSAHQRRLQAAAGGNSRARVCGSLPIVRDTARRRVRSGQVRPAATIGTALHRPSCGRAAMQPCSHAAMPRGERPPGRALRAVNNAMATSVPPPPLWAAVAMLPRGISPRGRRAPRCRHSRA